MFTAFYLSVAYEQTALFNALTLPISINKVYAFRPFSKNQHRVYPPPHDVDTSIPTLPSVLRALVLFTTCKRRRRKNLIILGVKE